MERVVDPQLDRLAELLDTGKIAEKSRDFAKSLLSNSRKWGLSEGRAKWVGILINEVTNPPEATVIGGFAGVYALFEQARKHLKYPKVQLRTEAGHTLKLYLSGSRSRMPDTVNATDGGRFGENLWFGRIDKDGAWVKNRKVDPARLADAEAMMRKLVVDPAGVAAEYGKLTGACCFCHIPLGEGDDKRSLAVGYGPVCAKNYGLPWGNQRMTMDVPTATARRVRRVRKETV